MNNVPFSSQVSLWTSQGQDDVSLSISKVWYQSLLSDFEVDQEKAIPSCEVSYGIHGA